MTTKYTREKYIVSGGELMKEKECSICADLGKNDCMLHGATQWHQHAPKGLKSRVLALKLENALRDLVSDINNKDFLRNAIDLIEYLDEGK